MALLFAVICTGAYFWFNREPAPIRVAEPGVGGQRILLGDAPANYYAPAGPGRHPATLLLGGSEGSLREARNVYARTLAAEGYAVLYPGYYMTREENRSFNMVPFEIFDRALAWMASQPEIDGARIAVIGHSKGAEGALILASRYPRLRAVIAAMPSDIVWQGFAFNRADMSKFLSSRSWQGKPLPYAHYAALSWYQWFSSDTHARMYSQSRKTALRDPQAIIAIDKIKAKILLICGVQSRAKEEQASAVNLLSYPAAGHWGFGPINGRASWRFWITHWAQNDER